MNISTKVQFAKIWPTGNMTALVTTTLPREEYSEIANNIMLEDRTIEQVGFIEKASDPRALARLQMMGGEFCGNATRSLGYFLFETLKKYYGVEKRNFYLEVSGIDKLIYVSILKNNYVPIDHHNDSLFRSCQNGTLVRLDGIQHFVTTMPENIRINPELLKLRAYYTLQDEGLMNAQIPAAGAIFVQKSSAGILIHPLIWVQSTGTFIYETSCASGTLATALVKSRFMQTGTDVAFITQPSGLPLKTIIRKKFGKLLQALISGPVEIFKQSEWKFALTEKLAFREPLAV